MDALSFLQRVLPSSGLYVSFEAGRKRHKFHSTIEDLLAYIQLLDSRGANVYYAVSAFRTNEGRTQRNTRATKLIALDVDCGPTKPFPSWKEGLVALGDFVAKANLPRPTVVRSGNGLHAYWVLSEELEPERWKPLAEAFKQTTRDHEFDVDLTVPADSARVLRVPGTTNPRGGKRAQLIITGATVTPEELAVCLPVTEIRPRKEDRISSLTEALAVKVDYPPADPLRIIKKCQQVAWATHPDNQKEVKEPMWYAMIGVATACQDPEKTAIEWSQYHHEYTLERTLRKLAHRQTGADGPTLCDTIEQARPGGCKGCKFKGKVSSPATLGHSYKEVTPPQTAPDLEASQIPLPRPYKRTADGMKLVIDDTDIDVCKFDIYPVGYGKDESLGYETVRYHWNRPHVGWKELVLRQAHLTKAKLKEFTTDIADQGIVLFSEKQTEYFQIMLRTYMEELRQRRTLTNLYATMGWKEDFSQFVIGDTVLRRNTDGTVTEGSIALASGTTRLGQELWTRSGSLEEAVAFTSLLDKADLRSIMFALTVGLSAPLYAFTGLKGLTVSLHGPTGGGKSLAQLWVQSLFGNPDKLHFAAKFTQNSLFGRMGLYCHMPLTIDEVTMMDNKEVGDFAYWVSQGRDKARMTRNAEERDAKTWAMPVLVSTNKSLSSKLVASGLDTDAQLARILEVTVPANNMFSRDSSAGRKIYEFITTNYGHIGPAFIKKLLELGEDDVRAIIKDAGERFRKKYKVKFSGEERFWEQALVLADLTGQLATDWELIDFDYQRGIEWVLAQIGAIRRSVSDMRVDGFDLLTEYFNEHADEALIVTKVGINKPVIDFSRMPRASIRIRFELYKKDSSSEYSHGVALLDRAHFRQWLSLRGGDYKTFMSEMQSEQALATPKSGKVYLAKDSPAKMGQTYVVGINLSHSRLQGILTDADQALEDLAYGQIKLVTPQ